MKYKDYSETDKQAREYYFKSHSSIIRRSFETDLWMKVISKAIDDIIYLEAARYNKKLTEEEEQDILQAKSFLFSDDHRIHFDDYEVLVVCPLCENKNKIRMSDLASELEMCNNCSALYIVEEIDYETETITKEITLSELLSIIWGLDDISKFRKATKEKIRKGIKAKIDVFKRSDRLCK